MNNCSSVGLVVNISLTFRIENTLILLAYLKDGLRQTQTVLRWTETASIPLDLGPRFSVLRHGIITILIMVGTLDVRVCSIHNLINPDLDYR